MYMSTLSVHVHVLDSNISVLQEKHFVHAFVPEGVSLIQQKIVNTNFDNRQEND